tara:strand:+ start:41 stop:1519 length:1479 start_codon:yes stop_codon:yes gene_type:complete
MRFYEFKNIQISEGSIPYLVGAELFKKKTPMRTTIFIDKIKAETPFTHKKEGPVVIPAIMQYKENPESEEITDYNNLEIFSNWAIAGDASVAIKLIGYKAGDPEKNPVDINILKTSGDLKKDAEFGGSKFVAGGKEAAALKPADIGLDRSKRAYTEDELYRAIQENQVLQKTEAGIKVKHCASEIRNGNTTWNLSELTDGEFRAFRDDAGEYLGPLMMMNNQATFVGDVGPAFFEHLGIKSLSEMNMFFPAAKNEPGADAEGIVAGFINPRSNNKILISIKAGATGKGAGFSIAFFKIPTELQDRNPIASAFLEYQKSTKTNNSCFLNANWLRENQPDYAGKLKEYVTVPIPEQEINDAVSKKGLGEVLSGILAKMKEDKVAKFLDDVDKDGIPDPVQGYRNVFYGLERVILNDVNNNNVLPNLAPVVRETLQQNFIKLSNKMSPAKQNATGNRFQSSITWPNREIGTGKILLTSKNSMVQDPASRLSMSII